MLATRRPSRNSATNICIATVDLPQPPFSLPITITLHGAAAGPDGGGGGEAATMAVGISTLR